MTNETTRRTFFGAITAVLPLGLLGFRERKAAVDHESNVNWFARAMGYAKNADYWRERCLDAENAGWKTGKAGWKTKKFSMTINAEETRIETHTVYEKIKPINMAKSNS